MAIDFTDRVAIVTGAGGGLGRCYALELARRGARVVVNDLGGNPDGTGASSTPADATVATIRDAGGEAVASHDSVATHEGGAAIVQTALDAYGTVDIVINNAGILRDRAFANVALEDLRAVLDVHLLGAFHVTQPAFRVMKEKRYGRLLFTSSTAGLFGIFGAASYGSAKMGLVGLSNVLAIEGARAGITSNVIAPIGRSRLAKIEDFLGELGDVGDAVNPDLVTPLVLYLVSSECATTHEIFSAGGGRYARVFIAEGPGWFAGRGERPSVEDVATHFAAIRAQDGLVVPSTGTEEIGLLFQHLA